MPETRTGAAAQKLVDTLQSEMTEVVDFLRQGCELIRPLQEDAQGVNGLRTCLTSQANMLDKMISDLGDESVGVEKKMLGKSRPEIVSSVNAGKLAEVVAAKAEAS